MDVTKHNDKRTGRPKTVVGTGVSTVLISAALWISPYLKQQHWYGNLSYRSTQFHCVSPSYYIWHFWQRCEASVGRWEDALHSRNTKVHDRIHSQPSPVCILRQINPVHDFPSYNFKSHFNIIIPSTPCSSKWSHSLRSPHQNPVCTSPLPPTCYMTRQYNSSLSDHPNNIWWAVQSI